MADPKPAPAQRPSVLSLNISSKSALYAAFMPQFIVPTQPVLLQMVVLGAVFSGIALLVLLTYALLASRCRQRLASPQAWRMFNRMGAACLVAAGLFTASLQRES